MLLSLMSAHGNLQDVEFEPVDLETPEGIAKLVASLKEAVAEVKERDEGTEAAEVADQLWPWGPEIR